MLSLSCFPHYLLKWSDAAEGAAVNVAWRQLLDDDDITYNEIVLDRVDYI
jgi:hypothetical protein